MALRLPLPAARQAVIDVLLVTGVRASLATRRRAAAARGAARRPPLRRRPGLRRPRHAVQQHRAASAPAFSSADPRGERSFAEEWRAPAFEAGRHIRRGRARRARSGSRPPRPRDTLGARRRYRWRRRRTGGRHADRTVAGDLGLLPHADDRLRGHGPRPRRDRLGARTRHRARAGRADRCRRCAAAASPTALLPVTSLDALAPAADDPGGVHAAGLARVLTRPARPGLARSA